MHRHTEEVPITTDDCPTSCLTKTNSEKGNFLVRMPHPAPGSLGLISVTRPAQGQEVTICMETRVKGHIPNLIITSGFNPLCVRVCLHDNLVQSFCKYCALHHLPRVIIITIISLLYNSLCIIVILYHMWPNFQPLRFLITTSYHDQYEIRLAKI